MSSLSEKSPFWKSNSFQSINRSIYFYGLVAIAISLSVSKVTLSISTAILGINWFFGFNFQSKFTRIRRNWFAFILMGFYALFVFGLIHTDNFEFAWKNLRPKTTLFLLPLIIASSEKLKSIEVKWIFGGFLFGLLCTIVYNLSGHYNLIPVDEDWVRLRNSSLTISHIRLGIFLCFGMYIIADFIKNSTAIIKLIGLFFILLFGFQLLLIKTDLGLAILLVLVLLFLVRNLMIQQKRKRNVFYGLALIVTIGLIAAMILHLVNFKESVLYPYQQDGQQTINGEFYQNPQPISFLDNGNDINAYYAPYEVKSTWPKRSSYDILGLDDKGYPILNTLKRFLSSKGYRKDSVGISKLTSADIKLIEQGVPNFIYSLKSPIKQLYLAMFEYENYVKGGSPNGSSIGQRLEYWSVAKFLAKKYFWVGVGTGDVNDAFQKHYESTNSALLVENRLRSHNQFFTIVITIGVFGLIYFLFLLLYPLFTMKLHHLYYVFLLISVLAMMPEDFLDTQVSVTFFSFFISLFLFNASSVKGSLS